MQKRNCESAALCDAAESEGAGLQHSSAPRVRHRQRLQPHGACPRCTHEHRQPPTGGYDSSRRRGESKQEKSSSEKVARGRQKEKRKQ